MKKLNLRKAASVSMLLLLVFSLSTTTVRAMQFDMYPPFLWGYTNSWYVSKWTGGETWHSEYVDYVQGRIELYSASYNYIFGYIETNAQAWLMTTSVYAASSGVVFIAGDATLNGSGSLYTIAALPAGQHSCLMVRLSYEVQDVTTGQVIKSATSYEDREESWAIGIVGIYPIPLVTTYSWRGDWDITGSFMATAGHYYSVNIYFTISTVAEGGTGRGKSVVDFQSGDNCVLLRYVSLMGDALGYPPPDSGGGGGGGGCPILFVCNGSQYVCEGLLDIHTGYNGTDLVARHDLATAPQAVCGRYLLRLTEYWSTISYIDQVKLYATLDDGTTLPVPLVSAVHSQYGNVLPQLLFDDEWRVDEMGAKWNNGTSQSISLRFMALPPRLHVAYFTFYIEGYNPWEKT